MSLADDIDQLHQAVLGSSLDLSRFKPPYETTDALRAWLERGAIVPQSVFAERLGDRKPSEVVELGPGESVEMEGLRELLPQWDASTEAQRSDGSTPKQRREAFAEGLYQALSGRDPLEHPLLPGAAFATAPPWPDKKGHAAYEDGWTFGQSILRALDVALGQMRCRHYTASGFGCRGARCDDCKAVEREPAVALPPTEPAE